MKVDLGGQKYYFTKIDLFDSIIISFKIGALKIENDSIVAN